MAEELTQETFVEAIRNQDRFDGRSDPLTWMCAIARHKLLDHYRRLDREERRRARLLTRAGTAEPEADVPESRDTRDAVRGALGSLPAMQRAVLVLHYLDELSVLDIGAAIGRSESAVESLLSRGRDGFRRAFLDPPTSGGNHER